MSTNSNPNIKIYKFVFTAHIKTVTLALKFPCVVSIIWKRGNMSIIYEQIGQKSQQIKQRKVIEKGIINFNEQLQLQCNMTFDTNKKQFQQKKTKFTVLIFSQKGNKQAGQVHLDVSQLLNSKNKQLQLEKVLEKCPDKNAKLNFTLSGYMKEQITQDQISKKSDKTLDLQQTLNNNQNNQNNQNIQPDFKKKKNQNLLNQNFQNKEQNKNNNTNSNKNNNNTKNNSKTTTNTNNNNKPSPISNSLQSQPILYNKSTSLNALIPIQQLKPSAKNNQKPINLKQNISLNKLLQQNRLLKQELKQFSEIQLQNQNLKRKYEQADKKAQSYYKKKYKQIRQQQTQILQKHKQIKQLINKKQQLQNTYCQSKQTIGKIFNYVIITANDKLMDFIESQNL